MPSDRLPLYLSSSRLRLLLRWRSLEVERRALLWPNRSLSPDLRKQSHCEGYSVFQAQTAWNQQCLVQSSFKVVTDLRLKGDRLRLLGERRDCRRGDRERRLSGEWLTLRRAGLVSYDLPVSLTRARFLKEAEIFDNHSKRRTRKSALVILLVSGLYIEIILPTVFPAPTFLNQMIAPERTVIWTEHSKLTFHQQNHSQTFGLCGGWGRGRICVHFNMNSWSV